MRIDNKHATKLTEPGGLPPYTTPSVFAALAYPDSIINLITHQAVAQEPWISNTLWYHYPYRPSGTTYLFLPHIQRSCQV